MVSLCCRRKNFYFLLPLLLNEKPCDLTDTPELTSQLLTFLVKPENVRYVCTKKTFLLNDSSYEAKLVLLKNNKIELVYGFKPTDF